MFGVLVVQAPDGRIGYLKAFSGMLAGRWTLPGFAPPVFDEAARDAFWPAGEAALVKLDAAVDAALAVKAEAEEARDVLLREQTRERTDLAARHLRRKESRDEARRAQAGGMSEAVSDLAPDPVLTQASSADTAELRALKARHALARPALEEAVARAGSTVEQARATRHAHSCALLEQMFAGYDLANFRGERRTLRELFAPHTPPGGAGDCAAPKLFVAAQRRGLRPLALAELWWGTPPATGGRQHEELYPACRGKCGPVLAHLCDGLDVEPPPVFGAGLIAADEPRVLFEDDWLLIVDKPVGLLSVPGRSSALQDCVRARLRQRYPQHPGLTVVHRLDLDTSGLLLVAKDQATYVALQAEFSRRRVTKRYVAWLQGQVSGTSGTIDLPLRVDLDDRPRQIHDPLHGKAARTQWQLDVRKGERCRVLLFPETGRTHQLRVHAAHPAGLGAPIVGDRLYGREAERLLLHAEALTFTHPQTQQRLTFESPAPF
jgi:tRNA pseudouridine32 synthase/23S rRNA pseudouridine746 synthase